jgi:hypothetical protein
MMEVNASNVTQDVRRVPAITCVRLAIKGEDYK